jgi:hypothetical protein
VFSPVMSRGIPVSATGFLKSQGNIFNVGITRARGALVVVGDAAACESSEVRYLSAFARYVADNAKRRPQRSLTPGPDGESRDYPAVAHPERVSDWERILYAALGRRSSPDTTIRC